MQVEIIEKKTNDPKLIYKNFQIKICILCGYDKIESYEFGVSCEDCGTLFGRSK